VDSKLSLNLAHVANKI